MNDFLFARSQMGMSLGFHIIFAAIPHNWFLMLGREIDHVRNRCGTMPNQRIQRLVEADADQCPYFAIVLVHGHGRRPEVLE